MGDSRYYSPEQFFSIIVFTALIIMLTISFMLSIYKVERYKKTILTTSGMLGLSILSSFIAMVAHRPTDVFNFQALSVAFLIIYILLLFIFFTLDYMKNRDCSMLIIFSTLFFIPTVGFIVNPGIKSFLYPLFVANSIVLSNKFVKYRVSSSVFSDVKKLMLDYVFIIGTSGEVIYESDKISASTIFKKLKRIDVNHIESIFCKPILTRNTFGKQFIKLEGDELFYFQYHIKEIFDKEKLAGYILTFTDITELIAMLDELRDKQTELATINRELIKTKEIVYAIEREKEIENLFDDIVGTQHQAMQELKSNIEKLNITDENFIPEIEKLIFVAKANLKDVRNVVTAYSSYYEGGYDD
ncbi:hypothetical protein JR334_00495 [Clostridia bacterium]|nr:hypothetical protein JR334_00495 [Clostridia bacterium]